MSLVTDNKVYFIEGLAINGLIKSFQQRGCGDKKLEVIVETLEGETLSTGCLDEKTAKKIIVVLSLYSKWGKTIAQPSQQ